MASSDLNRLLDTAALDNFLSLVDKVHAEVSGLRDGTLDPTSIDSGSGSDTLALIQENTNKQQQQQQQQQQQKAAKPAPQTKTSALQPSAVPGGENAAVLSAIEQDANERYQRKLQREAEASALKTAGNALMEQGKAEAAAEKYSEALKVCPGMTLLLTNRALAYLKLARFDDCIKDCDKAIELEECGISAFGPHIIKAHLRKAEALKQSSRLQLAAEALQLASKKYPNNPELKQELEFVTGVLKTTDPNNNDSNNNNNKTSLATVAELLQDNIDSLLERVKTDIAARFELVSHPCFPSLLDAPQGPAVIKECLATAKAASAVDWAKLVVHASTGQPVSTDQPPSAAALRAREVISGWIAAGHGADLYKRPIIESLLALHAFDCLKLMLNDKAMRPGVAKVLCSTPQRADEWVGRVLALCASTAGAAPQPAIDTDAMLDACACATILIGLCEEPRPLLIQSVTRLAFYPAFCNTIANPASKRLSAPVRLHLAAFVSHVMQHDRNLGSNPAIQSLAAELIALLTEYDGKGADFAVRGLAALAALSTAEATVKALENPDNVKTLVSLLALKGSSSSSSSSSSAKTKSTVGNAALLVARFAQHPECRKKLESAIPPLIDILRETLKTDPAAANAAIALSRFAQDPEHLARIQELHGIELIRGKFQ